MIPWTTRPAAPADASFLFELYAAHRGAEVAGWGWPPAMVAPFVRQQFEARSRGWAAQFPSAEDRIVMRGDRPVGRVLTVAGPPLHLVDIALHPDACGAGLGTAVLQSLQARGVPMMLTVAAGNPARGLYARLGFEVVLDDGLNARMTWHPKAVHDSPTMS